MAGFIIVIEGSDSSGKATQSQMLCDRLIKDNHEAIKISFPNYESDSSALVKMYLNGELGDFADDTNPYTASSFYAVDRIASFQKWGRDLDKYIKVFDRYTISNMIHQGAKISDKKEKEEYLNWLWDFEFNKLKLPIPDIIFFLDMPPDYSIKLMEERKNKITGGNKKDIHEKDIDFLIKSYNNSIELSQKYGWERIRCVKNESIKSINEIHEEIYSKIVSKFKI